MKTEAIEEIKKVITFELPGIMKNDPETRKCILSITRESYSDRRETESRFDRIMDELQHDREARDKKWEAQDEKWDEERKAQDKKWDENQRVINETLASIKKLDRKHDATIGALGARWGLHSESAFRKGLRAILEGSFCVKVERYKDYDHDGTVFGRPEQIELDVIVHNGTLILCEIKSSMSKSELYTFWRKKNFYEEKHARKADRVMVISPMIDSYALSAAKKLDIEIFGYAEDVKT